VAKHQKGVARPLADSDTQEEMTVVILRIKGGGDTLQKGLDALNRAFSSLSDVQVSNDGAPRRLSGSSGKHITVETDPQDREADAEEDDPSGSPEMEATQAGTPSGVRWKPRKYKFMDNLDLTQSGKPWKEYASESGGKSDSDHYLVAALWLTECANLPEFEAAHIFTLFRAVRWPEQADFSQPMRTMKAKKSYFSHPTARLWKLTGPGLDAARALQRLEIK
jgi:hypothetical protein